MVDAYVTVAEIRANLLLTSSEFSDLTLEGMAKAAVEDIEVRTKRIFGRTAVVNNSFLSYINSVEAQLVGCYFFIC